MPVTAARPAPSDRLVAPGKADNLNSPPCQPPPAPKDTGCYFLFWFGFWVPPVIYCPNRAGGPKGTDPGAALKPGPLWLPLTKGTLRVPPAVHCGRC